MNNMTRKGFLLATATALGGCASFNIGRREPRRPLANERLTLATIGCGTMGLGNQGSFLADKRVQVVATCDPVKDSARYGYDPSISKKYRGGRVPAAERVDKHYKGKGCRAVADWREIVADPTIDAVLIATTDHWHAIIAIAAMKAGKHVYCQKPLTMSIAEGRRMCEVAKETGVVFQTGSQQRSAREFREACELFANGYLGDCKTCRIGLSYAHNDSHKNGWPRDARRLPATPDYWKLTPDEWDMWQGPAQHWENNAFIPGIHGPMVWRWNDRTGNGALPDWGAHHLDILQWAMGSELGGPVAIENVTSDIAKTGDAVFNWPCAFQFDVVYANGFRATVCDSDTAKFNGLKFQSSKGDLFVTRGKLELPAHLAKWKETDLLASEKHLHRSRGSHESDFVDAIFDPSWQPACPCEVGHRSITISHLANSCIKTGVKSVKWDARRETSDNAAVNARADIKRYNGWELG